jgi:signal transduction histidine kinase
MFRSVRSRQILALVIVVAVTLGSAGAALFARLDGYRDELAAGTLRQVAAPIYYNVTLFPVRAGTLPAGRELRTELRDYLELQHEETGVIVLALDADGHVIPDSTTDQRWLDEQFAVPPVPERGPDFSQLSESSYTTSEGERIVYVTVPMPRLVRAQAAGISAIAVALPDSGRRDVWADLFPRLVFAGVVGVLAGGIVAALLWGSLFRTLRKATGAIQAVAAGDYDQRVPETGPTEVRALARDVNRMAESVQISQRTLREFLANVSHELRTPLTSIRGFAQALEDGTLDTAEERARAARVIDAESRRVLQLVTELLDLARIESGQQRMDLQAVDASELLRHTADVFSMRAAEAGVTLDVRAVVTAPVLADFDRVEQVLGNLVDNALGHTARGGRIELSADGRGDHVAFAVSDDGPGIPPADLPHVFDRFYRSGVGEPQAPGSGLGLAISREIVRAHGGEIRALPRDGGGAVIEFTLPVAGHDVSAVDASAARGETHPEQGLQPS